MLPQPIFVPEDMPVVAEKYLPSGNRLVLEAFLRQGEDLDEALSRGFMLDRLPGYHISALRVEAVKEASTRLEQLFSKNLKQTSLGGVSLRDKSSAVESHVGWEELPVSERLERVVQEGEKGTLSSVLNLWQKVQVSNQNFAMSMRQQLPGLVKQRLQKNRKGGEGGSSAEEVQLELEETFHQAFMEEDQGYIRELSRILSESQAAQRYTRELSEDNDGNEYKLCGGTVLKGVILRKEEFSQDIEQLFQSRQEMRQDLVPKSVIKGGNKFLKGEGEVFGLTLCLGQQKKMRIAIKVLEVVGEEVFHRDLMEFVAVTSNYFKRKMATVPQRFVDYVTMGAAYLNQLRRDSGVLSSRLDGSLKFMSELCFESYAKQMQRRVQERDLLTSKRFVEVTEHSGLGLFQFVVNYFDEARQFLSNEFWEKTVFGLAEERRVPFVFVRLAEILAGQGETEVRGFARFLRQKLNELSLDYSKTNPLEMLVFLWDKDKSLDDTYHLFCESMKKEFQ